jgi:hypothetical protein
MSIPQYDQRGRWGRTSLLAAAAAALVGVWAFSASEAWAARSAVFTATCGTYNWCAPSQGGQANCDFCCQQGGVYDGGICFDDREQDDFMGCICYDN